MNLFKEKIYPSIQKFFFDPCSARPLGLMRIAVASLLIFQAFTLAPDLFEFYGKSGLFQSGLLDHMGNSLDPLSLSRILNYLSFTSIGDEKLMTLLFLSYLLSLAGLLIGWKTRLSAISSWILHYIIISSSLFTAYGVDQYANFTLFYFVVFPVGAWGSADLKSAKAVHTSFSRLAIRVMQIHLCITYFAAGIWKMQGPQWWNGEAIWRSLMLPPYNQYDFSWVADFPILAMVLCWGTLLLETFYPIFIWPKLTRRAWIIGVAGMHIGIIVFLGLSQFGLFMTILSICLFESNSKTYDRISFRIPNIFARNKLQPEL